MLEAAVVHKSYRPARLPNQPPQPPTSSPLQVGWYPDIAWLDALAASDAIQGVYDIPAFRWARVRQCTASALVHWHMCTVQHGL